MSLLTPTRGTVAWARPWLTGRMITGGSNKINSSRGRHRVDVLQTTVLRLMFSCIRCITSRARFYRHVCLDRSFWFFVTFSRVFKRWWSSRWCAIVQREHGPSSEYRSIWLHHVPYLECKPQRRRLGSIRSGPRHRLRSVRRRWWLQFNSRSSLCCRLRPFHQRNPRQKSTTTTSEIMWKYLFRN